MLWAATAGATDNVVLVTTPASQNAKDFVHWSQLGADQTSLATTFPATSVGGLGLTVGLAGANSIPSVVCASVQSNCSWTGGLGGTTPLAAGDTMLSLSDAFSGGNGPANFTFSKSIGGVGAIVQANAPGSFTARIQVFNGGASLAIFSVSSDPSGDPVYIGALDKTASNITSIVFSISACGPLDTSNCTDFGIDTLDITQSDFALSISNPVIFEGATQSANFTGTLTTTTGYSNAVAIVCGTGQPATCSAVGGPFTPTLAGTPFSVSVGSSFPADFNFNIVGDGSDANHLIHSQPVTLHVFTLTVGTPAPSTVTVAQGNTSTPVNFSLSASGSLGGQVTLSCLGLPAGASCLFSPSDVVSLGGAPANLSVVVNSNTASTGGPTPITISASTPGLTTPATNTFSLTISAGSGSADLAVTAATGAGTPSPLPVGVSAMAAITASDLSTGTFPASTEVDISFNQLSQRLHFGALPNNSIMTCTATGTMVQCLFKGTPASPQTIKIPFTPGNVRLVQATAVISSPAADPNPANNTAPSPANFQVRVRPFARKGLQPIIP